MTEMILEGIIGFINISIVHTVYIIVTLGKSSNALHYIYFIYYFCYVLVGFGIDILSHTVTYGMTYVGQFV